MLDPRPDTTEILLAPEEIFELCGSKNFVEIIPQRPKNLVERALHVLQILFHIDLVFPSEGGGLCTVTRRSLYERNDVSRLDLSPGLLKKLRCPNMLRDVVPVAGNVLANHHVECKVVHRDLLLFQPLIVGLEPLLDLLPRNSEILLCLYPAQAVKYFIE